MNKINADINRFPSITWHSLHINHGHIDGYIDSSANIDVSNIQEGVSYSKKSFVDSFLSESPIPTQLGAELDSELDSISKTFENSVNEFIIQGNIEEPIYITYNPLSQVHSIADYVINCKENSSATFIFDFRGAKEESCIVNRIRLYAASYSKVHIISVNMLNEDVCFCNGIGSLCQEKANVEVTSIELGAKKVFSGCKHSMCGLEAATNTRFAYIARKENEVDINYVARHIGKETQSLGSFSGVVMDKAKKTWRGTLDFPKGCIDSKGDEQENILLLSKDVLNKSMPVILCDEEAVDGRHGASIGRLSPDVLLYLQSRGIDEQTARSMMIKSCVNALVHFIPNENLKQDIQSYMEGVF